MVIALKNLTKIYGSGDLKVIAVNNVSMEIARGEMVAAIGRSGSGKTTLLNMIGCLDKPSSGQIVINGTVLEAKSDHALSRIRSENIGFIFQDFGLLPLLSAFENIEYPLLLQRVTADVRRKKVTDLLDEVGLADKHSRRPDQLSGGQQQRIAVARALVSEPQIVLADEPTANLDDENADVITSLIARMCHERNMSAVIATHDIRTKNKVDRVVELRDGKIVDLMPMNHSKEEALKC